MGGRPGKETVVRTGIFLLNWKLYSQLSQMGSSGSGFKAGVGGSWFGLRPLWTTMSSYSSWGQRGPGRGAQVAATLPAAQVLPPTLRTRCCLEAQVPRSQFNFPASSSLSTTFQVTCVLPALLPGLQPCCLSSPSAAAA